MSPPWGWQRNWHANWNLCQRPDRNLPEQEQEQESRTQKQQLTTLSAIAIVVVVVSIATWRKGVAIFSMLTWTLKVLKRCAPCSLAPLLPLLLPISMKGCMLASLNAWQSSVDIARHLVSPATPRHGCHLLPLLLLLLLLPPRTVRVRARFQISNSH